MEPHRPRELVFADSTQEYFRRFYLLDKGKYFYTARTSEVEKLPAIKRSTDDCYYMELGVHMESMTMGMDFIYGADKKYILTPMEKDTDIVNRKVAGIFF